MTFTDHKIYIFNGLHAQDRVLDWFLLLEIIRASFEYLPEEENHIVDTLSLNLNNNELRIKVGNVTSLCLESEVNKSCHVSKETIFLSPR
jgi:hypothetical protein